MQFSSGAFSHNCSGGGMQPPKSERMPPSPPVDTTTAYCAAISSLRKFSCLCRRRLPPCRPARFGANNPTPRIPHPYSLFLCSVRVVRDRTRDGRERRGNHMRASYPHTGKCEFEIAILHIINTIYPVALHIYYMWLLAQFQERPPIRTKWNRLHSLHGL